MFRKLFAVAALVALTGLNGCAVLDAFTAPSTPVQANSVAAAESLYTAADKSLTGAVQQHAISVGEAKRLGAIDNQVYAALVKLRDAAEHGDSVAYAGLLAAFNAADGPFLSALSKDGVAVALGE